MSMLQVGALGVAGVLLAVQFKNMKAEYGTYISIALGMIIFGALLNKLVPLLEALQDIADSVKLDSAYLKTLWKMIGITYVAEFASSICKDAGYQTIALQIEIFAKITIMVLSLPVLMALLETIRSFLI